ncbi:XK-related protein 8-like [Clarias gariepinus]|uniref:XK-related protein 8-like n=1 Tax=Clarias gariepinus TaxID=13013 RepID=UPI00234D76A8|nr:XK-related protein 8-like [Clarias gariepinus]
METFFLFDLPLGSILFPVVSLLIFVVDIVLDLWAVVCLYEEQKYFSMGLLIFLLLSSSVLLQIFSWIWYSDPSKHQESKIETFISIHSLMAPVHIFQLGVFLRFAAVMEISIRRFKQNVRKENLNHDLSMLRLFEAFSESAPQLVLMTSLIMETQEMEPFTAENGMAFVDNLLPVESVPDWSTCGVCVPLRHRSTLPYCSTLPVPVDVAGHLGLVGEHRLYGH